MRLSELLHRNIMETGVGRILNKFKIRSRRSVLFFEDILANFVKDREDAGYEDKMKEIAEKWGYLGTQQLTPSNLKILSPTNLLNVFLKRVWTNIGLMDDLFVLQESNTIKVLTKNESITRIIGKNEFSVGCFLGILAALFKRKLNCIEVLQEKEKSEYVFEITDQPFSIDGKDKGKYNRLNYSPEVNGFTLKNALRRSLFKLKGNQFFSEGNL